jgi:asparagine synthase (glutamine-hydrolysing)
MLDKISHRGPAGRIVAEAEGCTLGMVWNVAQVDAAPLLKVAHIARDVAGPGQGAQAQALPGRLLLTRDELGAAPLYYGRTDDGRLCFASEVKAVLEMTRVVRELPPGHYCDGKQLERYFKLSRQPLLAEAPEHIARELRHRLSAAVRKRIRGKVAGAWLSGGLDSSTVAALARPHVRELHTFAAGIPGAADLEHARNVATFIKADHHEILVNFEDLLAVLPEVVYHLESFDALLVRSSLMNYLVAREAANYAPEVFSGESGDELFAGYAYLKSLAPNRLARELTDITSRLHNTALQRVDRCATAHGGVAHVPFLDPDVVDYAQRIPVRLKLRAGVGKWILREAMQGALPEPVLRRTKAKFWEGAGVGELMAQYAGRCIGDDEFRRERRLANGWRLRTKEELMYYRIFRGHFGDLEELSWLGRTKGASRRASKRGEP